MNKNNKLNINVSMTGKEYIDYKNKNKFKFPKLSKNIKEALPYFIFSFTGIIIISLLIDSLTVRPIGFIQVWYNSMPIMIIQSWEQIGKFTFLSFAPFLMIMMGLAWLLHGFGFLIIKR